MEPIATIELNRPSTTTPVDRPSHGTDPIGQPLGFVGCCMLESMVLNGINGLAGITKAQFAPAYAIVRKHEGGYVNDPKDLGGETYRGIARKIWPNWSGWPLIDFHNGRTSLFNIFGSENRLKTGQFINDPGLESQVIKFYQDRWRDSRAGEIESQSVANIYFDFYILASSAVRLMQETLNTFPGVKVAEDNRIGPATIGAINRVNPKQLHDRYKRGREGYHRERVADGRVDGKFLPGWLIRTNNFPSLTTAVPMVGWGLAAGLGLLAYANRDKIKKAVMKNG